MILAPVPPAKVQGAGLFLLSSEGGASKPTCNLSDAVWTLPLSSASDVSPGAGPTASTHANMAAVAGPRPTSSASPGDLGSTLKAGSSSLDPDTAVNSSNRASSSNGKAPETNGVSSNGTSSPEAGAGGGEGGAEMSRPGPEVNPIFQVKEQIENLGEEEAHLEQTKDGGMVVKPGKQPSSRGWIPWRSKSDRDIVDGGLNLSRNPADQDGPDRPATTTQANGKGVGLNGEDPDPTFSTTSSGVDSVRMKIFTKLLPEGVEQHPAIPQRADRLDVSDLLNVRPQSPGHSTQTSISGELASLTSSPPTANGDLPSSKGDAQGSASPVASASDAAANGQDPHGLDLPPSEAKDGSRPRAGSTPGQAVVGQPEGLGVANSRLTPATEDSPRLLATGALLPQFDPHHSSSSHSHEAGPSDRSTPSPNPGRRSAAMQRANTAAGGLEVASSSRNLEASPSRQFGPSSPSMGQRTKSHDPTHFRRAMGKDEPPARQRSGDDFEDEMARKADVMRRERRDRREAEKDDGGHSKDKGKRRVSGTGSEGEKEKVLVGNLIGEGHENYVMMYNMLTGIRIGVSRCQAKLKRPLTDDDYTARHKFSFDIVGNELTPSAKYDFKFKDYAPWVFRELREYFHLDPADYLLSLTAKYILSELGSPGKSGSFFYFSRDYRFIIKTIHHSEHKFLRKILKQYHEHVKKNPHTLLSRFYGLHRVKLPRGRKIHFVIMNNLFPPHRDIHETYDLKGSSVGREYPEEKAATKPGAVLKDLNWVKRGRVFDVGPEKRALFEEQLRRDTELLQRLGIMDYSLLIGFHNMTRGNRDKLRDDQLRVFQPETARARRPTQVKRDREKAASALRKAVQQTDAKALSEKNKLPDKDRSERKHFIFYQDEGGFQATDDDDVGLQMIYYLGIIDILTPYTCIKAGEHFWKGLSNDKHAISAVPPIEYGNRFLGFLFSVVRGADLSTRPKGLLVGPSEEKPQPLPPGDPAEKPPPTVKGEQEKAEAAEGGEAEVTEEKGKEEGAGKEQ